MPHFNEFFDSKHIGFWSLGGGDCIATITKVGRGTVGGQQGREPSKKAIITFREFEQPMACNKTNAKTIAKMYGADVREWVGKRVTLYPTTTRFGGEEVECIRVRPKRPTGEGQRQPNRQVDPAGREKQNRAANREHPAAALGAVTDAKELLAAVRSCAKWIEANMEKGWPKIVALCEKHGVEEIEADAALQEALSS